MEIMGSKVSELDEAIDRLWFRIVNHDYRISVFIDHKRNLVWSKTGSGPEARYTRAGFLLVGVYDFHIIQAHLIDDIYNALLEVEPLTGDD